MTDWTKKVFIPADAAINTGLSAAKQSTMLALFGVPGPLTVNCSPLTNKKLKSLIVTQSVGPFRVTGLKLAVLSLVEILLEIKEAEPDLYDEFATEGMLCCRRSKGASGNWSNHSWGTALDSKVGELDDYGSFKCAAGLLRAYYFFHKHGWYWGAEFPTPDAMHWETANETLLRWRSEGLI